MSEGKVCPTCGSEYPVSERFCPRDGSALKSLSPEGDLVGSIIAERYHVIRKLGEGGMGSVYLAEHVKMGRKSAIKVMNPGSSKDADAIQRFNREASNASRMNHPNICAIYDFGETPDGMIYLAMEFIEGTSLTDLIEKEGALSPARAASILHQTADALQVAHDYGIVHRDLKPDNIMIAKGRDNTDLVKVVDFGIAKAHENVAQKVTKTGLVVGTPEYMSPEQLAGDKLDGRSDIYSLALVGFNMLTGSLPFPAATAQEAMIMRLTDSPKTLSEMRPNVNWSAQVQAVMDKALARDVNQRYQKAADFGREFAMAVEAMPSFNATEAGTVVISMSATPVGSTMAIPQTRIGSDAATPRMGAATVPEPAKGKGMIIGVSAVSVAAVAVAIFLVMNGNKTPSIDGSTGANGSSGVSAASGASGASGAGANSGVAANTGGTDAGRTGGNSNTQRGTTPPVNPPTGSSGSAGASGVAANSGESALTVASQLLKYDNLDPDALGKEEARAELAKLSALIDRATVNERTQIYFFRALMNYRLDDTTAFCRNHDMALAGPGIKEHQITALKAFGPSFKCK